MVDKYDSKSGYVVNITYGGVLASIEMFQAENKIEWGTLRNWKNSNKSRLLQSANEQFNRLYFYADAVYDVVNFKRHFPLP